MRSAVIALTLTCLLFSASPATAESQSQASAEPEVMGFVEWVVMGETGIRLKARLNTGAKTSSLHAVNVEPFEKDNEDWVRFQLPLGDHEDQPSEGDLKHDEVILEFERPVYRTVLIKRKGAPSQRRYVVEMDFCLGGKVHETQFSLTDRGKFSYPVLLGRRLLLDDNILTDSGRTFIAELECEYSTLEELAQSSKAISP